MSRKTYEAIVALTALAIGVACLVWGATAHAELFTEFGITPSSRSLVAVTPNSEEEDDFDEWLRSG